MIKPGDKIARKAIDEVVDPQIEAQAKYLPAPAGTQPVGRAHLLYVCDQYGTERLDFTAGGDGAMAIGHSDPETQALINEQLNHHGRVGGAGEYVLRLPLEYAMALSHSLTWAGDDEPLQVAFTSDERAAREMAAILGSQGGMQPFTVTFFNFDGSPQFPPKVQDDVDAARRAGQLVVADECRAGFGRAGEVWAQRQWGIKPDITVVGGPAGGGFPFGAVVTRKELFTSAMEPRISGSGYAGHPVICAAGLTAFRRLTPELMDHVTEVGRLLHDSLEELRAQFPELIQETRGAGLLQTLTLHKADQAVRLVDDAHREGLILAKPKAGRIRLTPPLIISELEVRRAVDMIAAACLEQVDDDETT
ncbi:aminotransferase [Mycobacterium phage ScoobyDoobyDoo]|nr:aminotransferase [Mycobacterium phage ScoobyDoobyDoo]